MIFAVSVKEYLWIFAKVYQFDRSIDLCCLLCHATFALFYKLIFHFILKINLKFGISGEYIGRRLFINQINIWLLNWGAIWILDYSFHKWIIQSMNGINFPIMNSLVSWRRERLTCCDYKTWRLHGRQWWLKSIQGH